MLKINCNKEEDFAAKMNKKKKNGLTMGFQMNHDGPWKWAKF